MKRRQGTWYSDFRLSNGERVRKSLRTSDKAEGERLQRAMQVRMEDALTNAPPEAVAEPKKGGCGMTLRDAFQRAKREWEPWRASKSPSTIDNNFEYVTAYFKKDQDLSTIDREALLDYAEALRDAGKSPSTINQRLSLLSVLMKVAEGPTKGAVQPLKMPRQKVRNGRIRVLSRAEEANVVGWFSSPDRTLPRDADMAALVVFLLDTGFRLGEALALETREVDWEAGMVPAWETKADLPRFVPMTSRVRSLLDKRRKMERPFGMFSKDYADGRWEAMRKGLKIDVKKDPEFVIHALRHTCASRLAAAGEDAFRIQKWMGHKNIQTTQKYVTLFAADLKDLAVTLERGYQGSAQFVPESVPKDPNQGTGRRVGGPTRRLVAQGNRRIQHSGDSVGVGLLIRRSLVRAQVGEPAET